MGLGAERLRNTGGIMPSCFFVHYPTCLIWQLVGGRRRSSMHVLDGLRAPRRRCTRRTSGATSRSQREAEGVTRLPQRRPSTQSAAHRWRSSSGWTRARLELGAGVENTALRAAGGFMASGLALSEPIALQSCSDRATPTRSRNRAIGQRNLKTPPMSSKSRATRTKSPRRSNLA